MRPRSTLLPAVEEDQRGASLASSVFAAGASSGSAMECSTVRPLRNEEVPGVRRTRTLTQRTSTLPSIPLVTRLLVNIRGGHEYHLLLGAAAVVCMIGALAVIPIKKVH
jgi:hypothetical protein